ncbi:amphi-Trp domain-containing protein [Streptomyces sp. NPDC096079]|uniref:amphi-Trp domain-containing protein n=1 Tax=Streptomyces sp. NPDC096079 TaxID=3155820 RepID=UPI003329A4DD
MSDLKFEQKSALSRTEAAEQLETLAAALRAGEDAELAFGPGVLSLKIPDMLRAEVEFEVEDGEIELEIELKWRMDGDSRAPAAPEAKKPEAKKPEAKKPEPKKADVKKPEPKKPPAKTPATKKAEVKGPGAGKPATSASRRTAPKPK